MPRPLSIAYFGSLSFAVAVSACGGDGGNPSGRTNGASGDGGTSGGGGTAGSGKGGTGTSGASTGGSAMGGSGAGGAGTGGSGIGGNVPVPDEPLSPYIVVDDFGYRPEAPKVAIIRDPVTGFDAAESFEAGSMYALVDAFSGARVHTGS